MQDEKLAATAFRDLPKGIAFKWLTHLIQGIGGIGWQVSRKMLNAFKD
jgi:hypothetical protein